ncbi:hypothetical protein FALBO_2640 [Fusarium albosuccineum]|uniref:Uncharacterized protein n=1 Tax=Fusarium albosuccineum TaxID=1237068 RepID=A0A8H4LMT6_9HYPO|nr:hypothetical protein FALBO_2640 [Fusarium albosuccineum]
MHFLTILSICTVAAALPAALDSHSRDIALAIPEHEISDSVVARLAQRSDGHPTLVARALYDQTVAWPAESINLGNISFQVRLEKQANDKYKLTWWNTDPANSNSKIKLTLNAGGGSRIFDIVTSPRTTGTAEITPRDSTFRVIFDRE